MSSLLKRIMSIALAFVLIGVYPAAVSAKDSENERTIYSLDDAVDVLFRITDRQAEGYHAYVEILNVSGETIDDWEIQFQFPDQIEEIQNAVVVSHENDIYIVKGTDKNEDIAVDGKVSFEMEVKATGGITFPKKIFLTKEWLQVEGDYKVEYQEESRQDNHVKGQIIITNHTGHTIRDWKLDLISNLKIEDVWDAKVVSEYEDIYRFDNVEYNQDIETGQSIRFGFVAAFDKKDVSIKDYVLLEMTPTKLEDEDLLYEEDEDAGDGFYDDSEVEELDETLMDYLTLPGLDLMNLELDDFESYEIFEQYLQFQIVMEGVFLIERIIWYIV